jgi:hypothetical protein
MTSHPDFICVGAQKAATTWLHDVLLRVPGIFLPKIKELHYFSELYAPDAKRFGPTHREKQIAHIRNFHLEKNSGSEYERLVLSELKHIEDGPINDDWYRGIFSFAHDNEICGEVCPCYLSLPARGVRHVLNINPLMRILIIVRDPIDRIWSHMRMHIKSGYLNPDIDAVIGGNVEMGPYLRYTDYATAIPRWESLAGENRVKVMLYDEIVNDAPAAVDEILTFIGMPGAKTKADISRSIFSGQQMSLPTELHAMLLEMMQPQYDYLAQHFPGTVERWLRKHREYAQSATA